MYVKNFASRTTNQDEAVFLDKWQQKKKAYKSS